MTTQPESTMPDLPVLLARQTAVSQALSSVTSLQEAALVVQALCDGDNALRVGLLVYIYDEMGRFAGIRRIHGSGDSLQDETIQNLALSRVGETVRSLVAGVGAVSVPDVDALKGGDAIVKNWLHMQEMVSCVALPIRLEEKSVGALVIMQNEAGFVPAAPVNAVYQSVANQIATIARLHMLADEVEGARQENRTLSNERGIHTQASRELLSARDGRDVLRILKAHLARDARQIALYTIEWDDRSGVLSSFRLEYLITQNGEMREPDTEMLNILSADERALFEQDWRIIGSDVDFIEDFEQTKAQRPVLRFDYERGIRSAINIPVYDDDQLVHQISIAYETARVYPEALRRVYAALRDQINVVLQNRRLLRTTEENLHETRALYDINRQLMNANDAMAVLRVLRTYIANDDATLSLREFDWSHGQERPNEWTLVALIDENGEQTPHTSLMEYVKPEDFAAFQADWEQQGNSVDFIEDIEQAMEQRPALKYYHAQGYRSSIVIPVYDRDSLAQQIRVSYKTPRSFTPGMRRLYGAIRDQMTIILQNRRLLRITEESLREAQTIYAVNRDLLGVSSPAEVLEGLREYIAQDADMLYMTTIGWNEDESTIISVRVNYMVDDEGTRRISQELMDSTTPDETRWLQDFLRNLPRDVELIDSVQAVLDERIDLRYAHGMGARSLILLPVFRRSRVLHQIGVLYRENRHFTAHTVRLYTAVNEQIGVIMQNQRLLENSQRQAKQLQMIADFGQAVQSLLEFDTLVQIAIDSMQEMLNPHFASIYVYDSEHGALRVAARMDEGEVVPVSEDNALITDRRTTALQAWDTQQTFFSNNLRRVEGVYHTVDNEITSVIVLPLFENASPVGVIEVGAKHRDTYLRSDVAAMQQLAGQISAAIENAAAYRRSQRSAESKERVNEISSKLQQQMDLDRILSVTANELGRALGAKRARIRFGTRDNYAGSTNGHEPEDRE